VTRNDSDTRGRIVVSLAVALAAAAVAWTMARRPLVTQDFAFYFRAVQLWSEGGDPYAMRPMTPQWPLASPLYYPLPALILLWPLHALSQPIASAIFAGLPSGLLAWRLTARGTLWPLLTLASPSYAMAVCVGQWTPWLLLAMLWPIAGMTYAAKPTLGLACFIARPSKRAFVGALSVGVLSLLLWPRWPVEWLGNLSTVVGHPAPLWSVTGLVVALVLIPRWREPRVRLVVAMAAVPQLLFFADQVPLSLVAETKREAVFVTVVGWLAAAVWYVRHYHTDDFVRPAAPYVLLGCYLPALLVALLWSRPVLVSVQHEAT
jgi:hypothetical protein